MSSSSQAEPLVFEGGEGAGKGKKMGKKKGENFALSNQSSNRSILQLLSVFDLFLAYELWCQMMAYWFE